MASAYAQPGRLWTTTWARTIVGRMTGGGEPAEMPVVTGRVLARDDLCLPTGDSGLDFTMGYGGADKGTTVDG